MNVKKFRIGFSQCTLDTWRQTMEQEMKRELSFHPEIELIKRDANLSSARQVAQIRELVDQKIDLLIVSPNEAAPLTSVIDEVYASGLPVIVLDRSTISKNYTAFIGANNYKVGINAGVYCNFILKGKGEVLEINGMPAGSSADIGRHDGFMQVISQYPGIIYKPRFIADVSNHAWNKDFTAVLKANPDLDLVYAHDDRMALDVYKLCKNLGLEKRIKIIGVDGLPGENGGIDLVSRGITQATILYPTGGKEAIQTAINILEKRPYKKENELASTIIDSTNVSIMKLQNDKLMALQSDIDRSEQKINDQRIISENQANIIYTISLSLAMSIILGSVLLFYLNENKKINKTLASQNAEILNQRNQLIELSKQAKDATDAKINFFTNISHEFRTPLTLILAPLEELLSNSKMHFTLKNHLTLIQKNVVRLQRLINQLIDFRKIEADKMKLRASENDVVIFAQEIVEAFKPVAVKKHIDLRLITKERSLLVWFDGSMLDKVIFNLLSNAFKFTGENGYIHINIERKKEEQMVLVKVEDNGIGMSPDAVNHAFELFYQGTINDQQGSGLGLSLSKELIQLHHGSIAVASVQGKGTIFEIRLPLGNAHLEKDEIVDEKVRGGAMVLDQSFFPAEASPFASETIGEKSGEKSKDFILVIEDNPDLRNFLVERLGRQYEIISADNGITAIQKAFDNVPDLIISDVVLPGKDGFTITDTLKNDFRTSHIPIILLTAKNAVEHQVEGMRSKADAYIIKPFNLDFLEETIRSVLRNREILREHYTSELTADTKVQNPKKLDRKFINDFTAIIENNIGNESFKIDDICSAMTISSAQLYRKVKALLGYNVNDFILNSRIQKAKHYLNEGELSIAEISYKVGFASPAYFSTVFKAKCGVTPKEYRKAD